MSLRGSVYRDLILFILLVCAGFFVMYARPCSARAQELPDVTAPCAPEVVEHRRAVVANEGVGGIWFHIEVARCMAERLSALPLYVQRVQLLEQRLTLSDDRHALMERQVSLAEQGEQEAVSALDAAVRQRREAEEDRDAWHRSRVLWFAVGVLATGALVGLAAYALHAVGGT